MEWLLRYSFLVVIAVCIIFFSLWNPVFLSVGNQMNILEGSAILLIVALGMTLVVAMGGIDLSVGIALDFGAAFAVVALKEYDAAWYVAILVGIAGGCLIGLLNAALTVWLNVSACSRSRLWRLMSSTASLRSVQVRTKTRGPT